MVLAALVRERLSGKRNLTEVLREVAAKLQAFTEAANAPRSKDLPFRRPGRSSALFQAAPDFRPGDVREDLLKRP